jgi:hypothetical protein
VKKLWRWLRGQSDYDFWQLIDRLEREQSSSHQQIICDIDKTYLETQFESLIKIARIALETAEDKLTVAGASEFLDGLRWGDHAEHPDFPRALHFVSSSPPQLRRVLEDKLALDGLDWSSDTFKNQAYNVIKGRMNQLSHHIAYKTAAILSIMQQAPPDTCFTLIGDNAESDTYIYSVIAWYCAGVWDNEHFRKSLSIAGVEAEIADDLAQAFAIPPSSRVERILIREAPGYTSRDGGSFTAYVRCFGNYFDALLMLMQDGLYPRDQLRSLVRRFHHRYGFDESSLRASLPVDGVALDQAIDAFLAQRSLGFLIPTGEPDELLRAAEVWMRQLHEDRKQRKDGRKKSSG